MAGTASNYFDSVDLEKLAKYLGGAGAASASANQAEGDYLNRRDAVKAQLYNTSAGAASAANTNALNTAKFTSSLPAQGAAETARGSLLQNVQDVTGDLGANHANVINFQGGTRPSALSPEARAAGGDLIKHGQSLIANPGSVVPPPQSAAAPAMSDEPSAGFWGQAAGAGGNIAGLLSALMPKGGGSGGGGPINLKKIVDWIKGGGKGPMPVDDGYGMDPNLKPDGDPADPSAPSGGTVDTSTDFNSSDPNVSAFFPPDYSKLPGYGTDPNAWWADPATGAGTGQEPNPVQPGPDWGG